MHRALAVNCLKEHEKEKLLRRNITTAMPFGSSFSGDTTPPSRTGYVHRAFLRRGNQIYAENSK
jgi:hypothetical protein